MSYDPKRDIIIIAQPDFQFIGANLAILWAFHFQFAERL